MDRHQRLAAAKPTLTVHHDRLLGYYGRATVAGRTVGTTPYRKTEAEAWAEVRRLAR